MSVIPSTILLATLACTLLAQFNTGRGNVGGCNISGQCESSRLVTIVDNITDANDCSRACKDCPRCNFFTYFGVTALTR